MLSVYQLGARLGIDPNELLDTINGKKVPTQKVLKGLAKELDVSYFDLWTLPDVCDVILQHKPQPDERTSQPPTAFAHQV
jgi:transcriptional regulator with XRE-family HTH domain